MGLDILTVKGEFLGTISQKTAMIIAVIPPEDYRREIN